MILPTLLGLLFLLPPAIGLVVALTKLARKHRESAIALWKEAGSKLGLEYHPGKSFKRHWLDGRIDGLRTEVRLVTEGGGKNSKTFTRTRVALPAPTAPFRVQRRGVLTGLTRVFQGDHVETGDVPFDREFVVRSRSAGRVRSFLDDERRSALRAAFREIRNLQVTESQVERKDRGRPRTADGLVRSVQRTVELAAVLAGTRPQSVADAPPLLEQAAAGEPLLLVGDGEVREAEPDDVVALELESEDSFEPEPELVVELDPASSGEPDPEPIREPEAGPAKEELVAAAAPGVPDGPPSSPPEPVEPVTFDSDAGLGPFTAPSPPPEPPAPESPGATEPTGPVGAEEVVRQLFAERRLGSQVERLFRETHHGRRVRGVGKLVRIEGGFDAGGAPCQSLLVEPPPGILPAGSGDVLLALRLASGEAPAAAAGQELSFEGELSGCDVLTRRLDVAAASVRTHPVEDSGA